jgi:HEAT repeat protein
MASLLALAAASVFALEPQKTAATPRGEQLVQQIVALLGHPDREFRAAALDSIRTAAQGTAQTEAFAAQLPKLDAPGQAALIIALGDRGDIAARPAVLERLNSSQDESVRSAALLALSEFGDLDDLPALIRALTSNTSAEQQAARTGLMRMRGESVARKLAAESMNASSNLRGKLIDVLAARRATKESAAILAATGDEDAQVRTTAMNALGQIGKPEQLAAMLPGVLKSAKGGERDNAERNVAEVCKRIEDEDRRGDALIAALATVEPAKRDELISLVGRVGGRRLIRFVADIATGTDSSRRAFGIDALGKWPDASPADTLLEIANKASDPSERRQAFQAFVKVCAIRDNRNDLQRLERMKQAMKEARSNEEKLAVISRTRTAYDVEAMRFVRPYLEQPDFCQNACDTIVELAHHRQVRDPHKAEFDAVLDKVIQLTKDDEHIERANRYKRGQTWERKK